MLKNKKSVVFAIFIGLILALLSNASIIYAASSSNEKEPPLDNEPEQTLDFDVDELTLEFLEQVAGVGMYRYNVVSVDWSTCGMLDPHHFQTDIKVVLSCNNIEFEALIALIDGKFWSYRLDGKFWDDELTFHDLQIIIMEKIRAYRRLFNASYCDELLRMLPAAMQAQNLTIENENASLKISYEKFMELHYTAKINGYALPGDCFTVYLSKTGLVARVWDNLAIYHVATSNVAISKDKAILVATPYAEAYADQNGQTIMEVNATLGFVRDIGGVRGDSFAIYPRWSVWFVFDKVNEENAFAYAVFIWADNGEVYHHGPQGFYNDDEKTVSAYPFWLFAAVFAIIASFSVSNVYVKRKAKMRRAYR